MLRREATRPAQPARARRTASTAMSVTSVLSATPQIPTVEASATERTMFATPARDEHPRDLVLSRPGDQELRDEIDRLMDEEDEREQRHDRRAVAVPVADPALDQLVGNQEQREREQHRGRSPAAEAGEEQAALASALARTLVLGEGRVEQARSRRCRGRTRARRASPGSRRASLPARRARSRRRRRPLRTPPCSPGGRGSCSS